MVAFISILPSLPVPLLPEMHGMVVISLRQGTEMLSTSGEMVSYWPRDTIFTSPTRSQNVRDPTHLFFIPSLKLFPEPYLYPVVPSFRDWTFPHENLPPGWHENGTSVQHAIPSIELDLSSAITLRGSSCRISDCRDCISCALVCPRTESDW